MTLEESEERRALIGLWGMVSFKGPAKTNMNE